MVDQIVGILRWFTGLLLKHPDVSLPLLVFGVTTGIEFTIALIRKISFSEKGFTRIGSSLVYVAMCLFLAAAITPTSKFSKGFGETENFEIVGFAVVSAVLGILYLVCYYFGQCMRDAGRPPLEDGFKLKEHLKSPWYWQASLSIVFGLVCVAVAANLARPDDDSKKELTNSETSVTVPAGPEVSQIDADQREGERP